MVYSSSGNFLAPEGYAFFYLLTHTPEIVITRKILNFIWDTITFILLTAIGIFFLLWGTASAYGWLENRFGTETANTLSIPLTAIALGLLVLWLTRLPVRRGYYGSLPAFCNWRGTHIIKFDYPDIEDRPWIIHTSDDWGEMMRYSRHISWRRLPLTKEPA